MAANVEPVLSVIVVIVSDTTEACGNTTCLRGCLEALAGQVAPPPMEIIVPYYPPVEGMEDLQRCFPSVRFVCVEHLKRRVLRGVSREHHDDLRAKGLAAARGEVIGLLEDVGRPDAHWAARTVEAHRSEFAAIGGAIENGIDRLINWAVYFCDFGRYQNPLPKGAANSASDANVSYKRFALESIRPIWEETFHETTVHWELRSHGFQLAISPEIIVYQHRSNLRLAGALKERFIWGRSYAATRAGLVGNAKRLLLAALSPVLPAVLLLRMFRNVVKRHRCVGPFLKAFPLTMLLTIGWSCGEFTGYLTGKTGQAGKPAAEDEVESPAPFKDKA